MISLVKYVQKQPLVIAALHLPPLQASHHPDAQPISATKRYALRGKT
jgi:hypothetical protein